MILDRTAPARKPARGTVAIDPAHPLARGLMGFWLMNEGAGLRLFDLLGRYHAVDSSTNIRWVASQRGPVMSTINTDYLKIAVPATEDSAGPISAAASVYPVTDDYMNWIGHNGNSGWRSRMNSGRTVAILDRGGTHILATSATIPLNQWSRLTIVMNAGGCAIYINGVLSTSDATAFGGGSSSASELAWCGQGTGNATEAWQGLIDAPRYWFRSLSASEVAWEAAEPYAMVRPILRRRHFMPVVAVAAGTGSASITLDALTVAATAVAPVTGQAAITLGALTVAATAVAPVKGQAAVTLGALTLVATGTVAVKGQAAITLGALTSVASATGAHAGYGWLGPTALLDEAGQLILDENGVPILDDGALVLGGLTLSATGVGPGVIIPPDLPAFPLYQPPLVPVGPLPRYLTRDPGRTTAGDLVGVAAWDDPEDWRDG